jgi:predicted nucleic acid-binding protein
VIAVDTSVVVAGFASWHDGHRSAAAVLERKPRIPAHALVESFSVLTRLPSPHRSPADIVEAFLKDAFRGVPLALPPAAVHSLLRAAVEARISGGAIYDALIGETSRHAGVTLVTRDTRAAKTYEALGVRFDLLQ